MPRVTLDTNEYISALHFGGAAMRLLRMAVDGEIELFISEPIIAETLRVLRDKFGWQGYDVFDAGQRLRKLGKVVTPTETLSIVEYDPPDNRILECAVESKSGFIVTEDNDLLRLKEFQGIGIMRASEFLKTGASR
ncbi:MAG: putative toxin-antitoxin system toxin component, PIN family [Terriglobia bacterium]